MSVRWWALVPLGYVAWEVGYAFGRAWADDRRTDLRHERSMRALARACRVSRG